MIAIDASAMVEALVDADPDPHLLGGVPLNRQGLVEHRSTEKVISCQRSSRRMA